MANLIYLKELVSALGQLMKAIATNEVQLQSSDADVRYRRNRKRLEQMTRILGPMPDCLIACEDGWQFWSFISKKFDKYQPRREYIDESFIAYYEKLFSAMPASFADIMLERDIEILDEVGSGGFGVVYRARHLTLEGERAVKKFSPLFWNGDPGALRRFAREAELLARLTHRGVVRFFDAGIAGDTPFITTEFIEGRTLARVVDEDGALSVQAMRDVMRQMLPALGSAHAAGVFHRDVKPANIMIATADNRAVILDFGAGNALTAGISSSRLTNTAIGTAGFIAPELFLAPLTLDCRSDVYSAGVTAHYLLTSRLPPTGDVGYYLRHAGVSQAVIEVLSASMAPIETRIDSAERLLRDLESAVG